MRLTLRTLLAYLDDVLEPSQTKEIGAKIQESPVAAALVSRVREVIRRRRLGAPEVVGGMQGVDANIVAQYLDNTLTDDQVADIERVCLESDLHLAEVAACHQILTLVLGEPLELPQSRRDRFYALGPVSSDSRLAPSSEPPAAVPTRPLAIAEPIPATRDFHEGLPDYLKPTPWSRRVAPVVGIAIVAIAAVFAIGLDRNLGRSLMGGGQPGAPAVTTTEPAATPPAPPRPQAGAPTTAQATPPGQPSPDGSMPPAVAMAELPPGIDPAPPADAPEPGTEPVAKPLPMPPQPGAALPMDLNQPAPAVATAPTNAVAMAPAPAPAPMPAEPLPPQTEPQERITVRVQYTSVEGILIRQEVSDGQWYVQPRRSELHPEEVLACPEPFEAALELDDGKLLVTLLGNTVVQLLPPTAEQKVRLLVKRGRLLVSRGAGDQVPAIELTCADQTWKIDLTAPQTAFSLDMQVRPPAGIPFPPTPEWMTAAIYLTKGNATVHRGPGAELPLAAGSMHWLYRPETMEPDGLGKFPDWAVTDNRQGSAILKRYATLFEREFDAKSAVNQFLPALTRDPRPKIAELSTLCLGTMEDYPSLTAALVRSEHAEARAAAAAQLRVWLIQNPDRVELLEKNLMQHYPGNESQAVLQLLTGFPPAAARDRAVAFQLVEWLRSNFVEVRELAIGQIEALAGRRYDYRPLGSPSQREPGIQRWMTHIEKEGALVKPLATTE